MSTVIPERDLEHVLAGLDKLGMNEVAAFVASARAEVQLATQLVLTAAGGPRQQARADAQTLNKRTDDPRALHAWFRAADLRLGGAVGEIGEVQKKRFAPGSTPQVGALQIPERIILRDDTVEFAWLTRAVDAGNSIAWLSVPRFVGGNPVAGEANGTGLLLGERHLLTCRHVLEAREPTEDKPDAPDLTLQVQGTRVAFGYLSGPKPNVTIGVTQMVASDGGLDYAVLELDTAVPQRVPSLFLGALPQITNEQAFVVNILQHPGGKPKRLAMRNNAVARIDDNLIAYWTDTDYGSSGAPVFNDSWQVVAVHRAYEERNGLQYLGRSVGGANIGSRITKIVDDLRAKVPALVAKLTVAP